MALNRRSWIGLGLLLVALLVACVAILRGWA